MANEVPSSRTYTGLSRKVLEYSEHFLRIVNKIKKSEINEADWTPFEELIDTKNYRRMGVFDGAQAEVSTWQEYRKIVERFAGWTDWEGTLRRITEVPGLVYLELEERNTRGGVTDVSNTVTIYGFNKEDKLIKLDVYVMPLEKR